MYKIVYSVLCWLDKYNIHILHDSTEVKVQKIFTKVINGKYYRADEPYMCFSLELAEDAQLITSEEKLFAKQEIKRYLSTNDFLAAYLKSLQHPNKFEDRLKIYQNWADRPFQPRIVQ